MPNKTEKIYPDLTELQLCRNIHTNICKGVKIYSLSHFKMFRLILTGTINIIVSSASEFDTQADAFYEI